MHTNFSTYIDGIVLFQWLFLQLNEYWSGSAEDLLVDMADFFQKKYTGIVVFHLIYPLFLWHSRIRVMGHFILNGRLTYSC